MRPTEREMTTALLHLRAVQLGISIGELDLLTIGMLNDMFAELSNDRDGSYAQLATQEDMDIFARG